LFAALLVGLVMALLLGMIPRIGHWFVEQRSDMDSSEKKPSNLSMQDALQMFKAAFSSSLLLRIFYPVLLIWIILALIFMFADASSAANQVKDDGKTVRPTTRGVLGITMPLLNIQAYPTNVMWKDSQKAPRPFVSGNTICMMYMGKDNNTTILYDVKNHRTVRFPSSDAVVEVAIEDSTPKDLCTT
jgi:hypothetical protein